MTGRYRGAAHSYCNLQLSVKPGKTIIPVVFLNLRDYDSHLIMQAISETEGDLKCIANNMEKYIYFSIGQLRFIDSLQFVNASLDKLVKSNDPDSLLITSNYEPDFNKVGLLLKKEMYPYEYMDNFESFKETSLPKKEAFYGKLNEENITDEEYQRAKDVYKSTIVKI